MINQLIKLVEPKKLEINFEQLDLPQNNIIVKPVFMSICAADQRYYQGKRKKEILEKKLPLTLIHEAIGEIVYDPKKEFEVGTKVVLIPNTPYEEDEIIKENYRVTSKFRSSSCDGFMQSLIYMKRDRIIAIENIKPEIGSMLELISVSVNSIENFKEKAHSKKEKIAIWGDGSVAYITALILKAYFPNSKIIVLGVNREKLNYFSFVDETKMIDEIEKGFNVDHAFECVGGQGSESAIEQIINYINPQGTISLLGVSEEPPRINTRMILEKGLIILGNSRSGYQDFKKTIELLQDEKIQDYVDNIICDTININNLSDIYKAFEKDVNNDFKTVMKWNL
ncbi:MAG: zinc-binding dehydrogenase [Clostridia bacterium]|nr:zinc-binding dehydrogenase [Clostridia bacterium]